MLLKVCRGASIAEKKEPPAPLFVETKATVGGFTPLAVAIANSST